MRLFRNPRLIAAVVVAGAVAGLAFWPKTTDVDVAPVVRGPMQVTLDEEGETRVRERFVVSAPVAGRLQRIALEPGDAVTKGKTVVARLAAAAAPLIDPRTQSELEAAVAAARAAVGQAAAERDRATAALVRARSNNRRVESLTKAGAVAAEELEVAQTTLRTAEEAVRAAEFTVARAEHELALARARLTPSASGGREVVIVAPVDGVVLRRLHESETVVPAGEPLVEIGDPASLEIVADFLSEDAVQIHPGALVHIERWGGVQPLRGQVRRVEPAAFMKVSALGVEEQRVNVIIDPEEQGDVGRGLGDGFRLDVHVVIWSEASALKAPIGGVFRQGDRWAAFVLEDGRARQKMVELGQRNDLEAQVLEGLAEGELVVLHPPDTLLDGARIRTRQDPRP